MNRYMKKKFLLFLVLVLIITSLSYFSFKKKKNVQYLTETVRRGNIEKTVKAAGDITASLLVDVGVQVTGQVKKLHVRLGQQVKKGDLIAEIDSTTQKNELQIAQAKLASLEAQLASKLVALDVARKNHAREKSLFANHSTSQKELEAAEERMAVTSSVITEIKSSIEQTKIAVSTAKANLGYTRVTAPVNGTIVSAPIGEGQTVNSVQSSPTIVQIADLSAMTLRMQIAEGDITTVRPGMRVVFSTLADPDRKQETTLQSIDPGLTIMSRGNYNSKTDPSNEAVYYYGRALVPNADNRLHIGMTTENIIFVQQAKNVLILPTVVIKQDQAETGTVLILQENGEVSPRQIRTGLADELNTQILSGLKEGEKVVSSQADGIVEKDNPGRWLRGRR